MTSKAPDITKHVWLHFGFILHEGQLDLEMTEMLQEALSQPLSVFTEIY